MFALICFGYDDLPPSGTRSCVLSFIRDTDMLLVPFVRQLFYARIVAVTNHSLTHKGDDNTTNMHDAYAHHATTLQILYGIQTIRCGVETRANTNIPTDGKHATYLSPLFLDVAHRVQKSRLRVVCYVPSITLHMHPTAV